MKKMTKTKKNKILLAIIATTTVLLASLFTGCSSVFSAGISGKIVDSESTSTPKSGIQDVEVFVYTKEKARDADYDAYTDTSARFSPTTDKYYIGHAVTDSSGEFSISKVVWQSFFPDFGKTADYEEVYLLFYHENFGLVKNSNVAMVMSDATANSVYQELTKIRTTTVINLTVTNVATNSPITDTILATISVPQNGGTARSYEATITTGTAAIPVTYPRYSSGTTVYKPTISVTLEQNGTNINFKQCNDGSGGDYSFTTTALTQQIYGDSCPVETYMKASRVAVPSVTGTYGDTTSSSSDGVLIYYYVGGTEEANLCGSTTTYATTYDGTDSQKHGNFSIEVDNCYWETGDYDTKTTSTDIYFYKGRDSSSGSKVTQSISTITSSNTGTINVTLN